MLTFHLSLVLLADFALSQLDLLTFHPLFLVEHFVEKRVGRGVQESVHILADLHLSGAISSRTNARYFVAS